jgi:hypothetical protein
LGGKVGLAHKKNRLRTEDNHWSTIAQENFQKFSKVVKDIRKLSAFVFLGVFKQMLVYPISDKRVL